jgi:hypothetical protein
MSEVGLGHRVDYSLATTQNVPHRWKVQPRTVDFYQLELVLFEGLD